MKLKEIREIAEQKNIKTDKLKKSELVRAIQVAEGYTSCFDTSVITSCEQHTCMWRNDCV